MYNLFEILVTNQQNIKDTYKEQILPQKQSVELELQYFLFTPSRFPFNINKQMGADKVKKVKQSNEYNLIQQLLGQLSNRSQPFHELK